MVATMRVLIIKTSSMGDIIHTLPALTDAQHHFPNIQFDWIAEQSFAEIPAWHPAVQRVIPINFRHWRKQPFTRSTWQEIKAFKHALQRNYDVILDAQGLVKSAVLGFATQGLRVGLDWSSARESSASLFYQRKLKVNFYQHAVVRMREIFAKGLEYTIPTTPPDFAIKTIFSSKFKDKKYLVLLHGTTWESKQWPELYWQQLAKIITDNGYQVILTGGNSDEQARAARIANQLPNSLVLPRQTISQMAALLQGSVGAIAVDTGFAHLAGALAIPTISIYGATNPDFSGALGPHSHHIRADFPCAPCLNRICTYKGLSSVTPACYEAITPSLVWQHFQDLTHQHSPL